MGLNIKNGPGSVIMTGPGLNYVNQAGKPVILTRSWSQFKTKLLRIRYHYQFGLLFPWVFYFVVLPRCVCRVVVKVIGFLPSWVGPCLATGSALVGLPTPAGPSTSTAPNTMTGRRCWFRHCRFSPYLASEFFSLLFML